MILGRLGLGSIDGSHFFVSAYSGQKQLFASGNNASGLRSIDVKAFPLK